MPSVDASPPHDVQNPLQESTAHDLSAHDKFFETFYDSMIGAVELTEVLSRVAHAICEELNATRATIYLVNKSTQELESFAVVGNITQMIRVPIRVNSLAGYCALTGRTFVVPDAYGDLSEIDPGLEFNSSWDQINHFRTKDVICSPALFKGEIVGVVQVINSKGDPFQASDLPPMQSIARLIGYALYHAKLYDDIATLKQLEKEKAAFMRIMVHELKSPVSASKMLADAYSMAHSDNEIVQTLTSRISERMDEMVTLVSDVLELARVKEGSPLGDVTVLNFVKEVESSVHAYKEQAESKELTIQLGLPDEPLQVRMDSQGCRLILSNLISNAMKYTPSGSVEIDLQKQQDWAVFKVKDTGIGIPEGDIPKLFKEFFRASNAKKQGFQGTGVGLAGVKELVERFGGELELESVENEGSTFTVRLPIYEE